MKQLLKCIKNILLSSIYSFIIFVYVLTFDFGHKIWHIAIFFSLFVFGINKPTRLNLYYNSFILNGIVNIVGAFFFRFVLVQYVICFYEIMRNFDNIKFDLILWTALVSILIFLIFSLIASSTVIGIEKKLYIKAFIDELEKLIFRLLLLAFIIGCLSFTFGKLILLVVLGLIAVFLVLVRILVLIVYKIKK